MVGFFIKKAFFDGWDNLIGLVVYNLGFLLVLLSLYGVLELLSISLVLTLLLIAVVSLLASLYFGTLSYLTRSYAWYQKTEFADIKDAFLASWHHSMLHFAIQTALILMATIIIPFYLAGDSIFYFAIAVILFWVSLAFLLALMYYFPLASQMPKDAPLKTLKKSFLVAGDNFWFTIFLAIHTLISLALTIVFATLLPGVSGISLNHQVAVKLLMMKYDYLEAEGAETTKGAPWEAILFDEREKVGKRTLRGMLFPWKE